jgi:hypothetical protein
MTTPYAAAITAAYAHRAEAHAHISRDLSMPYSDEYGTGLLRRFSTVAPALEALLPAGTDYPTSAEDDALIENVHRAYVLGLAVLAANYNACNGQLAQGDGVVLPCTGFETAAQLALHELMASPTDPGARNKPRNRAAMRQLDGVHVDLIRIVEARQRQWLGLPATPATKTPGSRLVLV